VVSGTEQKNSTSPFLLWISYATNGLTLTPEMDCDLKIYYLELLRASEGTLSCWSRLHLSYPLQFQGGTSDRRPVVKIIAESLSQRDEKRGVPTSLSEEEKEGIRISFLIRILIRKKRQKK
jgi:hypothetical protein